MDSLQIGELTYLVLLLLALVVSVLFRRRASIGDTLKSLAQWGLIFAIVAVGAGLWNDIRTLPIPNQSVLSQGTRIELPRAPDGHYYARLQINGTSVDFVVDTGASNIVLTQADAKAVGVRMDLLAYFGEANTANGVVRTAPVILPEVSFGGISDKNVKALVNGGEMEKSLLGMTYLQRFSKIEISNGTLVLSR